VHNQSSSYSQKKYKASQIGSRRTHTGNRNGWEVLGYGHTDIPSVENKLTT
jgi:hypothetical protein